MAPFLKDPDATLDYRWDWSPYLAEGETITTSEIIAPEGITLDTSSHDATSATAWLSGGKAIQTYRLTNRITTNQGRTDDRSISVRVGDR